MLYWDEFGQSCFGPPPQMGDMQSRKWKEFLDYDERHPEVWFEFEKQSLEAASRGFKKIGAHLIIQLMRWEGKTGPKDGKYKLKNDYFPYFARKFLTKYPNHRGFFELRKLRSS